jgi:hypothetical protein
VIVDNLCLGRNKSLSLKGVPTPAGSYLINKIFLSADPLISLSTLDRLSALPAHALVCRRISLSCTVRRQQSLRSRRPVETSIVGESSSEDVCFYFQFVLFSLNTPIYHNRHKRNAWVSSLEVASRLYICKAPPSYPPGSS